MKLSFPQKMHYCRGVILPTFYLAPWVSPVGCDRISVIHKTQLYWLQARGYWIFNYRSTFLRSYFSIFIASDRNCLFKFYDYILCQYNPIKNFVRLYFERGEKQCNIDPNYIQKRKLEKSIFVTVLLKWSESPSFVSDSLRPHGLHSPWNSPSQNTRVGSQVIL